MDWPQLLQPVNADSTSEQLIQEFQKLIQPSEWLIQPYERLSQPSERPNRLQSSEQPQPTNLRSCSPPGPHKIAAKGWRVRMRKVACKAEATILLDTILYLKLSARIRAHPRASKLQIACVLIFGFNKMTPKS